MLWLRTLVLIGGPILICAFGFAYEGSGGTSIRGIAVVVSVSLVAVAIMLDYRPTTTHLLISYHPRRLLRHPAYGELGRVILVELDRLDNACAATPPQADRGEVFAALPPRDWEFVFLGRPGTSGTMVWSRTSKNIFPDDHLLNGQLWQGVLEGKLEAEKEPFLVLKLGWTPDYRHRVYRMLLRGDEQQLLCTFPVELLTPWRRSKRLMKRRESIAGKFGLRCVGNYPADHYTDSFGDDQLVYPEFGPGDVYEDDIFKFRIAHYDNRGLAM